MTLRKINEEEESRSNALVRIQTKRIMMQRYCP